MSSSAERPAVRLRAAVRGRASASTALDLPFSSRGAAEPAPRFYTMSLRRDCQLQRHYGGALRDRLRHQHRVVASLCKSPVIAAKFSSDEFACNTFDDLAPSARGHGKSWSQDFADGQ